MYLLLLQDQFSTYSRTTKTIVLMNTSDDASPRRKIVLQSPEWRQPHLPSISMQVRAFLKRVCDAYLINPLPTQVLPSDNNLHKRTKSTHTTQWITLTI